MEGVRIGEASRLLGAHHNTLREWERRGVLKPARTWCGWRLYSQKDLEEAREYMRKRKQEINGGGK